MPKLKTNNKRIAIFLVIAFAVIIGSAAAVTLFTDSSFLNGFITNDVPPKEEEPEEGPVFEEPELTEPVSMNFPNQMRAVYLKPGADFLITPNEAAEKVQKEIDAALDSAKDLTINTVIVHTSDDKSAMYASLTRPQALAVFDPLQYIIDGARQRGLYVYCVYDLKAAYDGEKLQTVPYFGPDVMDGIEAELSDFLGKYSPDGIFFDNYDYPEKEGVYAHFLSAGAGMSFEDYQNNSSERIVKLASNLVRQKAPGVQVGLLTEPQWATKKENESGMQTLAAYSMLTDGHSDVKSFIEDGLVDMFAVKAYGSLTDRKIPFEKVVSWWAEIAKQNNVRMYTVQASDRMANSQFEGWGASDQITKQMIVAEKKQGFSGCIFNDLTTLKKDPAGATTLLLKYFNKEVSANYIMTELSITKPQKLTYSTFEPQVVIRGASDPTNPVTMNGKQITTDKNGYFSLSVELKPGLNTIKFEHKEKTITFNITRNVKIFQSVTPSGSLTVDGNTDVTLVAHAYANANITATVGGRTVTLTPSEAHEDGADKDSFYVKYTGKFTTPAATQSVQNLGNIVFHGTWDKLKEDQTGASIRVNKIVSVGSGSPVVISAQQAETFPTNTLDDISDGRYFPLPKGALDYTVGDQIVYNDGNKTYRYYNLSSGLRVYANDISSTGQEARDVAIKGMTITADNRYTKVILPMSQPTSYSVSYSSSGLSFHFNYVKSVPISIRELTKNPIFSSATWSENTLTLRFRKSDGMCGYTASYSGNTLTLCFNNPPSSISGARIVIDPGHGGPDVGALGFYEGKHENYITRLIGVELAQILRNRGANVLLIDTSGSGRVTIQNRLAQAIAFDPQIFLSIHCNSAYSSSAIGNEAYYFHDFSKPFGQYVNNGLYSAMGNRNRGTKYGLYYVTRTSHFTSVLAECGFMSNQSEYIQLMNDYAKIASALANSIGNYISSIYSGYNATGTQSVGESNTIPVKGVKLDYSKLELKVGETKTLKASIQPEDATDTTVTWSTNKSGVVSVDDNGNLRAVAPGTAKITVKTKDGNYTASCDVTVKEAEVTGLKLDQTTLSLKVGDTAQLKVTVEPENAGNQTVTWNSNPSSIVSVDSNGNLKALKEGEATITASCGGKKATCTVTVGKKEISATGLSISPAELNLKEGENVQLSCKVTPEGSTDKLEWTVKEGSEFVSIDQTGKVTAAKEGSATITAKCGSVTADCKVTVTKKETLTISRSELTLEEGATGELSCTVTPGELADKLEWSVTEGGEYVSFDQKTGAVTAVKEGKATITVKCGEMSAACTVTVKAKTAP